MLAIRKHPGVIAHVFTRETNDLVWIPQEKMR